MSDYILGCVPLLNRSGHDAGRALLRELYRKHFREEMPEISVSDRGKPYFADKNIYFSISHTKRHAFCVLSSKEVGLDAEELDRTVSPSLAQRILSPTELAQYEAAPDKDRALLTFWVLKEAAAKATGEGLRGFPNHTDFSLNDPRVRELEGCLVAIIEKEQSHAV